MSACAASRPAEAQRRFDDGVDALRIERGGADPAPFVDAPKHRAAVDVGEASHARRASTGRPTTSALSPASAEEVLVRRSRRPGRAASARRAPTDRRHRLALFEIVNAKSSDLGTAAPAGAEGEQQQGAITKIDRPAPSAGHEQPIENIAGDRLRALARARAIGGADGETQRVSNGRITERAFDAAPAMQRRPEREAVRQRASRWRRALAVGSHFGGDRKEVGGRSRKEEYRSRHSCWRRFSMKWTVKLERIDEAGNLHSTTVGYVERPELTSEADLGLTHDDGKYLIRRVQAEIAQDQVRALISKVRPCPCCGRLRSIKEHRRRRIDTVFGHLRIHAPRFEACVCGRSAASSPMAVLFPHRSTPELRYLQVKLGCKFSYQQAADILNEFLPDLSCFNHATTRNRVLASYAGFWVTA